MGTILGIYLRHLVQHRQMMMIMMVQVRHDTTLFLPLWGWYTHWRNSIPNSHSQCAFGMILLPYLVKIAIYRTMHRVRCLATWPRNARHMLRHTHYMWSFPDYLLFIFLWDVAEIGSWTCVLEYDISYTRGRNFHHGTRQRLVPRRKFCPLV